MDECDCGWCGRCAKQLEHERYVQNLRGYGVPSWEDEMKSATVNLCGNGCGCDTRCMFPEG